jgi:hypothetical protein
VLDGEPLYAIASLLASVLHKPIVAAAERLRVCLEE